MVRRLFEPLGYEVEVTAIALDEEFPDWGDSRYVRLKLSGKCRLADLLNHLYVLLPVLDDDKHYWVDDAEIEKLMRRGEGWLAAHPDRDLIVRRYLKKQARLYLPALATLDEASRPRRRRTRATSPDARNSSRRRSPSGTSASDRPVGHPGIRRPARAGSWLRRRGAAAAPCSRWL